MYAGQFPPRSELNRSSDVDSTALKRSWERVTAAGDQVPLFFYSHLFLSRPELRTMFPVTMAAQRDKLVGALGRIVSNVDQLEEVTPFLMQLGRDHRRFAVVADHYDTVGASLIATVKHFMGSSWSNQLGNAWTDAYNVIADVMVKAAAESAATSPAWWAADVVDIEHRTLDVAVLQLHPQRPFSYLPGQSISLETSLCPRLWRYFSPANAPRDDGTIELHVQVVAGGQVSGALAHSVKAGHTVRLGPPVGNRLTRRQGDHRDILMVAGGTGLAPLRAVLEQIDQEWLADGVAPDVHLFHGGRTAWDLYEHDQLRHLARRPWFHYTGVASEDPSFPGESGLVGAIAARSRQWRGRSGLICGSPGMVSHAVAELTAAGMPRGDLRYEELSTVVEPPGPRQLSGRYPRQVAGM
jgi:NAD(P)H-flavin reductase/hemoglobin-like flavoprotein